MQIKFLTPNTLVTRVGLCYTVLCKRNENEFRLISANKLPNFGASIVPVPAKFQEWGDQPKRKFAAWTVQGHVLEKSFSLAFYEHFNFFTETCLNGTDLTKRLQFFQSYVGLFYAN